MRAARLLQMLLLLQNRGRMTCSALARELEVATRTILRDVDALTEAGLPIIVLQGNRGGIELGFNYRTRLTGLATDEAEAMAVILSRPMPELDDLGLSAAAQRARSKMLESFPDKVRETVALAQRRFRHASVPHALPDERVSALASAVRDRRIVTIRSPSRSTRTVHPIGLLFDGTGWAIEDALDPGSAVALGEADHINISGRSFSASAT